MGDSDFCKCSPIIRLPTREDLIHPDSIITPEEMLKYRTMQGFSPKLSKGSAEHDEILSSEKLPVQKSSELVKTKNQDFKCAEASLAHYNKIHSANYKLIEATNSHGFFCGWVWYHCVFKAAPETSKAPELFFAELHGLGWNKYHVITVTPVVNVARSFECWYCKGKDIVHPVWTLSQDPQLLYSEGMIHRGAPFQQLQYQKAAESLKKLYAPYPDAYHNAQKISSDLHKASGLESFNLITKSKIKERSVYKDEQIQDVEAREPKMDGLQSSTWAAELQKQREWYSQLGLGRNSEATSRCKMLKHESLRWMACN